MIKYILVNLDTGKPLRENGEKLVTDGDTKIAVWDSFDEAEAVRVDKTKHDFVDMSLKIFVVDNTES